MMKIKNILVLVLMLWTANNFAQNSYDKWSVAVGGSAIDFTNVGGFVGDNAEGLNFQFPNLVLTRYIDKGISLVGSITYTADVASMFNSYNLVFVDGFTKYDFGLSEAKIVPELYVGLGMSFAEQRNPPAGEVATSANAMSLNIGGGITVWVTSRIGLNGKFVTRLMMDPDISVGEIMGTHTQLSGCLIYAFGGSGSNPIRGRKGKGFTSNN